MGSRQRGGTTLVEVLVAIFIMAIGLMTLLTLFPLGALSMAQAIQDSRAGQAAANAAAIAEAKQLRHDDKVVYEPNPLRSDPNFRRDVFLEPLPRRPNGTPSNQLPPIDSTDPSFPSYPVFVDPIGYLIQSGNPNPAVGDAELGNLPGIPRRIPRYIWGPESGPGMYLPSQRIQYASRFNTLLDDLNFNRADNTADPPNAAGTAVSHLVTGTARTVERQGQYTWAYLLRRPRAADPSVVDVSVVVYNARPAQAPLPEHVFPKVTFNVGSTQLDVPYSGAKPDIKKGSWVLDATLRRASGGSFVPEPHGFFYRVVGVTDNGNSLTLELQEPIRPFVKNTQAAEPKFNGTLIFMEYVVEVFEKGSGWKP